MGAAAGRMAPPSLTVSAAGHEKKPLRAGIYVVV
jgi:hypothetical protein